MLQVSIPYIITLPDGDQVAVGPDQHETIAVDSGSVDFVGHLADITTSCAVRQSISDITQEDGGLQGNNYLGYRVVVMDISVNHPSEEVRANRLVRLLKVNQGLRRDMAVNMAFNGKQLPELYWDKSELPDKVGLAQANRSKNAWARVNHLQDKLKRSR